MCYVFQLAFQNCGYFFSHLNEIKRCTQNIVQIQQNVLKFFFPLFLIAIMDVMDSILELCTLYKLSLKKKTNKQTNKQTKTKQKHPPISNYTKT